MPIEQMGFAKRICKQCKIGFRYIGWLPEWICGYAEKHCAAGTKYEIF